jgi:hypothetical protein
LFYRDLFYQELFYQDLGPITSFAALVHAQAYTCARRAAVVPNKTFRPKQDLHRVKRSAWAN